MAYCREVWTGGKAFGVFPKSRAKASRGGLADVVRHAGPVTDFDQPVETIQATPVDRVMLNYRVGQGACRRRSQIIRGQGPVNRIYLNGADLFQRSGADAPGYAAVFFRPGHPAPRL